jgi:hypothetical protein
MWKNRKEKEEVEGKRQGDKRGYKRKSREIAGEEHKEIKNKRRMQIETN